ncbi:MAG TPA: GTP cyclohydrolase I, partial [Candidatus Paenibacillus intestinavium]|nr:GTP cyclohydrolase I [Candidatus Paenibacillus intestinavium]
MAGKKDYVNSQVSSNRDKIEAHITEILKLIGEDVEREGLLETPARVTRMYEEIFAGYEVE